MKIEKLRYICPNPDLGTALKNATVHMSLPVYIGFLTVTLFITMNLKSLQHAFPTDTYYALKCSVLCLAYATCANTVPNDITTTVVQGKIRT